MEAMIAWLKVENIGCVCAPFEAEWQLAFLEQIGHINGLFQHIQILGHGNSE